MVFRRNNVNISGAGSRAMMFSHGFGCDQNMWTQVARAFEADFRVIPFDHVGAGRSDVAPPCVGEHVHAQVPNSSYVLLDATGHCPNLSAPEEVTAAIRAFV